MFDLNSNNYLEAFEGSDGQRLGKRNHSTKAGPWRVRHAHLSGLRKPSQKMHPLHAGGGATDLDELEGLDALAQHVEQIADGELAVLHLCGEGGGGGGDHAMAPMQNHFFLR